MLSEHVHQTVHSVKKPLGELKSSLLPIGFSMVILFINVISVKLKVQKELKRRHIILIGSVEYLESELYTTNDILG